MAENSLRRVAYYYWCKVNEELKPNYLLVSDDVNASFCGQRHTFRRCGVEADLLR